MTLRPHGWFSGETQPKKSTGQLLMPCPSVGHSSVVLAGNGDGIFVDCLWQMIRWMFTVGDVGKIDRKQGLGMSTDLPKRQ